MAASYDFVQLDVFTRNAARWQSISRLYRRTGLTDKQMQALFTDRARESWVQLERKIFSKISFELRSSNKEL